MVPKTQVLSNLTQNIAFQCQTFFIEKKKFTIGRYYNIFKKHAFLFLEFNTFIATIIPI